MNANNIDRRFQKSQQAMLEALIELMAEKTYDAISIKDIVEKANVGRSTFYDHYQAKDDLLKSGFDRLLEEALGHIEFAGEGHEISADFSPFFQHAAKHYHLFKALMWETESRVITINEHEIFSNKLLQKMTLLYPDKNSFNVPLEVICISFSGNLFTLLKWWLENKMPIPPERMDEIFQLLVMPGIRAAIHE